MKLLGKMKILLFSNRKDIACPDGCAVTGPDNDVLVLSATNTEGHVPGGR